MDFYPYNMLSEERQSPFLTRLPRAIKEVEERIRCRLSRFSFFTHRIREALSYTMSCFTFLCIPL